MRFLNQKEEVIDVVMTQYGKLLFSIGKFKPVYYAFLDDSIIYNSEYCYVSESQNSVKTRIEEESPKFQAQAIFDGVETNYYKNSKIDFQNVNDRNFSAGKCLGTSENGNIYVPAFRVDFHKSEIDEVLPFLSGAYSGLVHIPQLNLSPEYYVTVETTSSLGDKNFDLFRSSVFSDGTYLKIEEEPILLSIEEENTQFLTENFDIEVFKIESWGNFGTDTLSGGTTKKEEWIPLKFLKSKKSILTESGELKEAEGEEESEFTPTLNDVEYYFDVFVDKEIDPEIMCGIKKQNKNFYTIQEPSVCKKEETKNIYSSMQLDDFEGDCKK